MLVLTRKEGEGIIIGEEIKISLVEIKGKSVRIGIEAPHRFTILRDEVHKKIVEENKLAASPDAKKVEEVAGDSTPPKVMEEEPVRIETTMFGTLAIEKKQIIIFPEGIIGFNHLTRYALIDSDDESPFHWLQSLDEPRISFLIVDPLLFKKDYRVTCSKEELLSIQAGDSDGLLTVVVVTVPKDPKLMTANLKGPIIINTNTRLARQVALSDETTRYPVLSDLPKT